MNTKRVKYALRMFERVYFSLIFILLSVGFLRLYYDSINFTYQGEEIIVRRWGDPNIAIEYAEVVMVYGFIVWGIIRFIRAIKEK